MRGSVFLCWQRSEESRSRKERRVTPVNRGILRIQNRLNFPNFRGSVAAYVPRVQRPRSGCRRYQNVLRRLARSLFRVAPRRAGSTGAIQFEKSIQAARTPIRHGPACAPSSATHTGSQTFERRR